MARVPRPTQVSLPPPAGASEQVPPSPRTHSLFCQNSSTRRPGRGGGRGCPPTLLLQHEARRLGQGCRPCLPVESDRTGRAVGTGSWLPQGTLSCRACREAWLQAAGTTAILRARLLSTPTVRVPAPREIRGQSTPESCTSTFQTRSIQTFRASCPSFCSW